MDDGIRAGNHPSISHIVQRREFASASQIYDMPQYTN